MTEEHEQFEERELNEQAQIEEYARAGFWMRFWAYSVDILATFSISAAVLSIFFLTTGGADPNLLTFSLSGMLSGAVTFLYFILLTKFFGQTLGKMLFGLRVISKSKTEVTWGDILFRELVGRFLHRFLFVTNILYLIVAFHPEKRGIHDYLGGTVVILEKRGIVKVYREHPPVESAAHV
ncbi:RDD family protein [Alkalicoccus daliensis]|uniref:Uncharacterized membrane protein YckC, RDD family n=1 Tax=Alkalicoccus daliensis TaxID=745820 RepID=A0A1H0CB59_9BACI|nr:RDD family protein [Alkalicoccus daliensis]SDN55120.1 Uncharacterized membrane protein YckC, RDD family [Alkalicoccus daliensis]